MLLHVRDFRRVRGTRQTGLLKTQKHVSFVSSRHADSADARPSLCDVTPFRNDRGPSSFGVRHVGQQRFQMRSGRHAAEHWPSVGGRAHFVGSQPVLRRILPNLGDSGHMWGDVDQKSIDAGQPLDRIPTFGPVSAKWVAFSHFVTELDETRAGFGLIRSVWTSVGRTCGLWPRSGRKHPDFDQHDPIFGRTRSSLVGHAPIRAKRA